MTECEPTCTPMGSLEVGEEKSENPSLPPRQSTSVRFIDSIRKSFFVIGTSFVVLVAFRNSVTWHLQQCWGASGDFWQGQWGRIYDWFEGDEYRLTLIGTFVWTMTIFWTANILLIILDLTGKPEFLLRYKIQPEKNAPVEKKRLLSAIGRVLFNQTVIAGPVFIVLFHLMKLRGFSYGRELPTFQWVLFEMLVCVLMEEVGFYYSHRTVHHPLLYKRIHKLHHEWTAPIGIIGLYAHPLEHVMSNMMPPMLGPLIMGSHLSTMWLWFGIALLSTTNAHSGYHFPYFPSPEAHDFHHLKFNQNYGVLGILDRLHGTDSLFRVTKQYERHIMFLTFNPPRQEIPDIVKNAKAKPE